MNASLVGRTLSRYRVVERLGEGGMGVVYRAFDERLQRDVALKVLSTRVLERGDARERLREEALVLSRLDHPAIATVHDYDSHDGVEFVVMEFVRGQTLAERIARGSMDERELVSIGTQVCEALAAAHERGVIHRDLKPANIMVTARGHVKVLDFGLATFCDDETPNSWAATREIGMFGTIAYMAPEQLLGRAVDERADVFALGAVLYELHTTVQAFRGPLITAVSDAVLHQPVVPPSQVRGGLSPALEAVVLRCLEKLPEDRYPSARALADDLQRALAGRDLAPRARAAARTRDSEAHRSYLRGRRYWSKRTRVSLEAAIEHFEAAIDRDPEHAPAYSGLADCYTILAPWLPPRLGYQKAKAAAQRAIELEPALPEAHTSLAFARMFADWDWAASEAGFRRAIELDPEYATAHQWYAELLTALGRFDEGLAEARAAEELDALSYAMPTTVVNVFYYARRYEEALEAHRRMAAFGQREGTLGGLADRARILEQSGRADEAVTEYLAVLQRDDDPRIHAGLACALALAGRTAEAQAELDRLAALEPDRYVPPYALAGPLALLGDFEGAFARLEQAFATRDRAMVWMRVNPRFDPLRGDARFAALVERMGFTG